MDEKKLNNTQEKFKMAFGVIFFGFIVFGKYFLILLLAALAFYLIRYKLINTTNFKSMAAQNVYGDSNLSDKLALGAKKIFFGFFGLIIFLWLISSSIYVIQAGTVGVYSLFGKVRDEALQPGFHVINPFANIERMAVRTQEYTMSRADTEGKKTGDDSIAALTREGLNISMDITVLYHLDQTKAAVIYKNIGVDFEEKVIRPEIRSSIRGVVSQYNAKDIYAEKRDEVNQKIFDTLKGSLDPRGIILEQVLLRDVVLPADITTAIQAKLAADQEAQKYDFILEKELKEKKRKIIEAEGQRESQRIINESLTPNYLYYQYVNQLKDRQGTIYVPISSSNGLPLFKDLGK